MKRRIFIAINLKLPVKKIINGKLNNFRQVLSPEIEKEIRFISPTNWHLTVSFLGYQDEDNLLKIINAIGLTAEKFSAPEIAFEKLIYGPPKRTPRMIWLETANKTSKKLSQIKEFLDDNLIKNKVAFRNESRPFSGHLTLARFSINRQELPLLDEKINLKFLTASLDLMESHLKRSGAEYEVIEKIPFKGLSDD